jgi:FdhD protein
LALALGFLFSEGIIRSITDVASIRHCTHPDSSPNPGKRENLIKVELTEACPLPEHVFKRHSFVSSSCGICGKSSIDAVRAACPRPAESPAGAVPWKITAAIVLQLPQTLRAHQRVFGATGGLHACGLFDTTGTLLSLHEDVGRHNAADKVIGESLSNEQLPLDRHLLLLSGRASFELIQKAAMAGLQLVCAVGAPSSLAVECALDFGITLIGFLRDQRFNVYSRPERVGADALAPAAL